MRAVTDYFDQTQAMLINLLRCETTARLLQRGPTPVMLPGHPFTGTPTAPAAEEQFEANYKGCRRSLAHLSA